MKLAAELQLSGKIVVDRLESYSSPSIVKTVYMYLLRRKSCTRVGLNFFIILLCQVKFKILDEKNTRHVYLLGKNINKPLVHFYQPLKFSSSNLSHTFAAIWVYWEFSPLLFRDRNQCSQIGKEEPKNICYFVFCIYSSKFRIEQDILKMSFLSIHAPMVEQIGL